MNKYLLIPALAMGLIYYPYNVTVMLQRVPTKPNHLYNVVHTREREVMGVKPPMKSITIETTEAHRRYSCGLKSHPPVTQ
jgi:hypothetical protein